MQVAAGKEISEEEGGNCLAPSSTMLQLGLREYIFIS